MNEQQFRERWDAEKLVYRAWGEFVVRTICASLESKGKDIRSFLKIPASYRLKDDETLVYKAFYRSDKSYSDPYKQIEDKVGARFVVLLLRDIQSICEVIETHNGWRSRTSKHFDEEKRENPLLFTYQSVHYILAPAEDFSFSGVTIPKATPCEVQIRTLLQHAHAELTHDAIYKARSDVKPEVHRTVAKCMALIETTDQFFVEATEALNRGPLQEHRIIEQLDSIYRALTGFVSQSQRSSVLIWETYAQLIDGRLIDSIDSFIKESTYLANIIQERYDRGGLYQQSVVLFVYWMLKKKKSRLLADWPLSREALEPLAVDLGVKTWAE